MATQILVGWVIVQVVFAKFIILSQSIMDIIKDMEVPFTTKNRDSTEIRNKLRVITSDTCLFIITNILFLNK